MDTLVLIGHGLFFTIGVGVGTAIMYFGPIIIEFLQDLREVRK